MNRSVYLLCGLAMSLVSCSDDKPTEPTTRLPTVMTGTVIAVTQSTARCGGEVTSDGGDAVINCGLCWSMSQTPTIADSISIDGTGIGNFTSLLSNLTSDSPYCVRAYATNSAGTGYGDSRSFRTAPTLTDIDGHSYGTVIIGTQVWMAENLNVTHYRNNEAIPRVTDNAAWDGLTASAYCEYNNNTYIADTCGRLYNSYAATDSRNIAPTGWHVPTDAEWQTLIDYLGGEAVGGGKLKEAGTFHWAPPNAGATNESGFCALPGGARGHPGYFYDLTRVAQFWSSTGSGGGTLYSRGLSCDDSTAHRGSGFAISGFSVRCVKD